MKTKSKQLENTYENMFEKLFEEDYDLGLGCCVLLGVGLLMGIVWLALHILFTRKENKKVKKKKVTIDKEIYDDLQYGEYYLSDIMSNTPKAHKKKISRERFNRYIFFDIYRLLFVDIRGKKARVIFICEKECYYQYLIVESRITLI